MQSSTIYEDIAKRTGGDVYIGVVGPVRTGKSTFIHRVLDSMVIPNIENEYDRKRAEDEMPQSASGRSVMTTEPKFVPDESVCVSVDGGVKLNIRLIDCVGYMVDGALCGEEGEERLVRTPWSDEEMPFDKAAELGTGKVIGEHSTIGILVTTDGTVTDLGREAYIAAEERVAKELSELGKPYAIVLNSKDPSTESARELAHELEEKYRAPVALVNCRELDGDDIREILGLVLSEFPVTMLKFKIPPWCRALPEGHAVREECMAKIRSFADTIERIGDISRTLLDRKDISVVSVSCADGTGLFDVPVGKDEYFGAIRELSGLDISDECDMIRVLPALASIKQRYERIESALADAEEKGYGIVMPSPEELSLDEPRVVKHSGGYCVRMNASADSMHFIKTGIKTELSPVIGTEEQCKGIRDQLSRELEEKDGGIWGYEVFGRTLFDLAKDGLMEKVGHMSDDSREKMGETLERIINEGANGLICILL